MVGKERALLIFVPSLTRDSEKAGQGESYRRGAVTGTSVILWWLYTMRKSQLYEQAGRTLLGEK